MNCYTLILTTIVFALGTTLGFTPTCHADDAKADGIQTSLASTNQKVKQLKKSAIAYLIKSQNKNGSWSRDSHPGISALVVTSLLEAGASVETPVVQKGLAFLETNIQKNGGIYHPKTKHRNYETSLAILAFQASGQTKKYKETVGNAVVFLKELQWDEGEKISPKDPGYGGAGYGKHSRPDLSNTQYFLEALKASGLKADDPAIQKAKLFISRTQNLESDKNNTSFPKGMAKEDKGGFYYTPAAGGSSQAGKTEKGGLRSYGSMTYAGLKSMIYAGLTKEDPRVKAAYGWIQSHYTLRENPGLGQQGKFYYFHTFAKTLSVLEVETFVTKDGVKHDWRTELVEVLAKNQREDGSWFNKADRWMEGDPTLVTGFALMALSHCEKK